MHLLFHMWTSPHFREKSACRRSGTKYCVDQIRTPWNSPLQSHVYFCLFPMASWSLVLCPWWPPSCVGSFPPYLGECFSLLLACLINAAATAYRPPPPAAAAAPADPPLLLATTIAAIAGPASHRHRRRRRSCRRCRHHNHHFHRYRCLFLVDCCLSPPPHRPPPLLPAPAAATCRDRCFHRFCCRLLDDCCLSNNLNHCGGRSCGGQIPTTMATTAGQQPPLMMVAHNGDCCFCY